MKHLKKNRQFGRPAGHRRLLLRNLIKYFFLNNGRLKTTLAKAKEIRPKIEKIITRAKKDNSVSAKREVFKIINNHKIIKKIFDEIAPKYVNRKGGYTRIYKLGFRSGDAAQIALITLVEEENKEK